MWVLLIAWVEWFAFSCDDTEWWLFHFVKGKKKKLACWLEPIVVHGTAKSPCSISLFSVLSVIIIFFIVSLMRTHFLNMQGRYALQDFIKNTAIYFDKGRKDYLKGFIKKCPQSAFKYDYNLAFEIACAKCKIWQHLDFFQAHEQTIEYKYSCKYVMLSWTWKPCCTHDRWHRYDLLQHDFACCGVALFAFHKHYSHTWYLSFFPHMCNFWIIFSPHKSA